MKHWILTPPEIMGHPPPKSKFLGKCLSRDLLLKMEVSTLYIDSFQMVRSVYNRTNGAFTTSNKMHQAHELVNFAHKLCLALNCTFNIKC